MQDRIENHHKSSEINDMKKHWLRSFKEKNIFRIYSRNLNSGGSSGNAGKKDALHLNNTLNKSEPLYRIHLTEEVMEKEVTLLNPWIQQKRNLKRWVNWEQEITWVQMDRSRDREIVSSIKNISDFRWKRMFVGEPWLLWWGKQKNSGNSSYQRDFEMKS